MADIFVSYSSKDRARVAQIVGALEEEGFSVWWDTHIDLGDTYDEVIEEELGHSKAAIVVWSGNSRKSRWVRSEAKVAEHQRKLVPIEITQNARPIAFELVQTEDFTGWDGDREAQCWKRLLIKLIAMVGEPEYLTAGPAAPPEPQGRKKPQKTETPKRPKAPKKQKGQSDRGPTPRRDGGGALTAVLTAIFGGAFVGALLSGSAIMAGGFALAGIFFWLFRLADTELPVQIRAIASRWLLPRQSGVHVSVAEAFNSLFEAVFTPRHWNLSCFWRSGVASGFFFIALFCFALALIPPVHSAFFDEAQWGAAIRLTILVFFLANVIGDYVSLFQTRLFLRWSVKAPSAILPLAVLDLVMTLVIYLAVLYGIDNGWRFAADLMAGSPVHETVGGGAGEALATGELAAAGEKANNAADGGFQWPTPYNYYNALIPQLFGDGGEAPLWARSWVLIFSVMTTFITSIWLWLVLLVGPLAKLTLTNRGEASFLGRMARIDRLPFTVVGMMVAIWVSLVTLAVSQLWTPVASEREVADILDAEDTAEAEKTAEAAPFAVGQSFRDCADCPELVVLPSGSFMMGSPKEEEGRDDNEGPQRRVTIGYRLAVGKFEVTWAEWAACVAAGGCDGKGPETRRKDSGFGSGGDEGWGKGTRPVINVTWKDAQVYAAWLSAETGAPYRLLSEAEWEYAARAGTDTPYAFGQTIIKKSITSKQANFIGDTWLKQTVPVGSYSPNDWGLYDMHGNVWERVEDCWQGSYQGLAADGAPNRNCGSSDNRVVRGGSWGNSPEWLRSAQRAWGAPSTRDHITGFRVARQLP